MADRYLLRCGCGIDLIVEPRNAGQHMTCDCGQQLKAPSLRNLRDLPRAEEEAPANAGGGWSFRQGGFTCGLLIAAVLAGSGLYVMAKEPESPAAYSPEVRDQRFQEIVESITPAQAYLVWWQEYQPLAHRGFEPMSDRAREVQQGQFNRARMLWTSLFGIAGVVALVSLLGLICFPGGPKRVG